MCVLLTSGRVFRGSAGCGYHQRGGSGGRSARQRAVEGYGEEAMRMGEEAGLYECTWGVMNEHGILALKRWLEDFCMMDFFYD